MTNDTSYTVFTGP